jgi:hypothetical protein
VQLSVKLRLDVDGDLLDDPESKITRLFQNYNDSASLPHPRPPPFGLVMLFSGVSGPLWEAKRDGLGALVRDLTLRAVITRCGGNSVT